MLTGTGCPLYYSLDQYRILFTTRFFNHHNELKLCNGTITHALTYQCQKTCTRLHRTKTLFHYIYAFKHALAGWKKAIKAEKLDNCPKYNVIEFWEYADQSLDYLLDGGCGFQIFVYCMSDLQKCKRQTSFWTWNKMNCFINWFCNWREHFWQRWVNS